MKFPETIPEDEMRAFLMECMTVGYEVEKGITRGPDGPYLFDGYVLQRSTGAVVDNMEVVRAVVGYEKLKGSQEWRRDNLVSWQGRDLARDPTKQWKP